MPIDGTIEYELRRKGYIHVAGVDEVGRGALAGPVVAAAVIFPSMIAIEGLTDSKKLSPAKREQLFVEIKRKASAIGIGIIDNNIIDENNILRATFMAMKQALAELPFKPSYVIVDGNQKIPGIKIKQHAIVKGDSLSLSISAASVVAKVTRDRLMDKLHALHPHYNWLSNKGYGTEEHKEAIFKHGPCPLHRKSFNLTKQLHLFT